MLACTNLYGSGDGSPKISDKPLRILGRLNDLILMFGISIRVMEDGPGLQTGSGRGNGE